MSDSLSSSFFVCFSPFHRKLEQPDKEKRVKGLTYGPYICGRAHAKLATGSKMTNDWRLTGSLRFYNVKSVGAICIGLTCPPAARLSALIIGSL